MHRLVIHNVLLGGSRRDITIEGNRFTAIAPAADAFSPGENSIDGTRFAILPPFYNMHGHAAMTLLRGIDDDLPLDRWLRECIWPREGKLTPEDVYAGSRLAILEMIKTGTVFFNDMYFLQTQTARAAEEMGIRCCLGLLYMQGVDARIENEPLREAYSNSELVTMALAPHAVYTTTPEILREVAANAREWNLPIHTHLSETAWEVQNCLETHGMTPAAYMDSLGLITERSILAHCVHLTDEDLALVAKRGASIAHCPASNQKLASGTFPYAKALKAGCRVTLGTDGAASNNSLSMMAEMKCAALSAKREAGDPTAANAPGIFRQATREGALALGIDAGEIAVGRLADAILVDLDNPWLVGGDNPISHLVYAADSSAIDTVICNGRIIMRGGRVPGEEEIIARAKTASARLRSA